MPNRPPKKIRLGKRPPWNTEPDYYIRERRRLELIEAIRRETGNMRELPHQCPGCDHRIWEACKGGTIWRGCHCVTLILPPGHRLYQFNAEAWEEAVPRTGKGLCLTSAPSEDRACVRTLTRIHPSLRDDPFSVMKGSLSSLPHSLGFACPRCQTPVRRGFTQHELTGFEFSFIACGCTGLSRFANLGDPHPQEWDEIVQEAAGLRAGSVKVHTALVPEEPEPGGPN